MKDFLKGGLSTAFGAVCYPLLSLWLNFADFHIMLLGIIAIPAKKGFTLLYQQETEQRFPMALVGAAFGFVAGIAFGAIAIPFMVLMTAYDFLYNLIIGAKVGYRESISFIWQTMALNWKPFRFIQYAPRRGYHFTSLMSFGNWLYQLDKDEHDHGIGESVSNEASQALADNEISDDILRLMRSPAEFYQILFLIVIKYQTEFGANCAEELAHSTALSFYIRSYFSGRYDLVQSYIQSFPAQRETVQETLFLACVEAHLLSNEVYLEYFLTHNPSYRQRARDIIKEQESDRNAFIRLVQIDPFPNNTLNEAELQTARSIDTLQMRSMLEQYDNLKDGLDASEDRLMGGLDFEKGEVILLSKQYLDSTGAWLAVPNATNKTTKGHIQSWFSTNLNHPLTRDNVIAPATYTNRPGRYVWYRFDESKQDGCQLLNQVSDLIRSIIKKQYVPEPISETVEDQYNLSKHEVCAFH